MKLKGIDVSVHNGKIDWKKVKQNYDFAFIRVGWSGYDGRIQHWNAVDKRFHENMRGANEAGIPVGVYVYSYTRTENGARIAAKEVIDLIKPYDVQMPVVFDMEFEGTDYARYSRARNTGIAKAFLKEIEAQGYYSMLYTFKSFAENNINMVDLASHDLWIAQIANKCTYTGNYGIWQYSWKGKVDGIVGDVDLNYAYKDYPTLIKNAGLNRQKKPTIVDEDNVNLTEENKLLKEEIINLELSIHELNEENAQLKIEIRERDSQIRILKQEGDILKSSFDNAMGYLDLLTKEMKEIQNEM